MTIPRVPILRTLNAGIVSIAVFAFLFFGPTVTTSSEVGMSPNTRHWLGTDSVGRDILLYAFHASARTIMVCGLAAVIAGTVGISIAVAMQLDAFGRAAVLARTVARFFDMVGPLLPTVALLSVYPKMPTFAVSVLLGLLTWPAIAGPLGKLLQDLSRESYVIASKALGARLLHQIRTHMLVPIAQLVFPLLWSLAGGFVAIVSTLEFLGTSSPQIPGVGTMLFESIGRLRQMPWLFVGAFLSFVSVFIVIGGAKSLVNLLIGIGTERESYSKYVKAPLRGADF